MPSPPFALPTGCALGVPLAEPFERGVVGRVTLSTGRAGSNAKSGGGGRQ